MLGVFFFQAADRRNAMFTAVFLELNKLRRIYHIAKNLSVADHRFRSWFTDLHGHLHAYLGFFDHGDLRRYKESNQFFRKLSYHIYTVPDLQTAKESALYEDLLGTTSLVAETRQRIKEFLMRRMSAYSWVTLLLIVAVYVASVLASLGEGATERLIAGAGIAAVMLAVDLLWEMDMLTADLADWARRYVTNIAKLEYRHEDEQS
jgi:hypothetical protein